MNTSMWRLRPAGAEHEGKSVSAARLRQAIEGHEVGDLDEVLGPGESEWLTIGEHPTTGTYLPQPRNRNGREVDEAESDMTPMIDVTFQLVIFFMIAATYTIQKTLDLPKQSPNPDAAGAVTMEQLEEENIIVRIATDGAIVVDDQPTPVDELVSRLRDATRSRRSAELVLDVDDQVAHDVVVKVIDAAGAANIEKVLFVSRVGS
ncbi:MAG: biopolymer transporter ExbD [Rhodospirillaceae bacterium]|nr:biopolymer transporter ExbD [Rhodospirillaceae bacterium]